MEKFDEESDEACDPLLEKKRVRPTMDFDSILDEIGEFGRFQYTNYFLVCLPVFFAAANSLSYVFTAAVPKYRCLVPDCDINGVFDEPWVHHAVPGSTDKNGFTPQHCNRFIRNYTVLPQDQCIPEMFLDERERCEQWVFDEGERTIVNDWLITCPENQWKLALVGTSHFAGIIVGSAVAGVLADNFGRKLILVICILFMSVTGVVNALSTNYEIFTFFTFLNAVGTSGVFPLAFIIGVEMVGKKKRDLTGIVLNYFYALGEAAIGLVAWLVRDWVSIQLIVSAPPFIFIIYYWIIPESVRWLLAKKRNRKAEKIVKKAAHINGVQLSDEILATFCDDTDSDNNLLDSPVKGSQPNKQISSEEMWGTFKAMISSRKFLFRMMILYYNWATCAFVFYGLSLNSVNLVGNKYLNFTLISLVEIPGYSLAWYFMNRIGRRWTLAVSLIVCGVTCIGSIYSFEGIPWISVTLSLIGKMGITASFGVIYVYSAEMLPTIIRSAGVGSMSTFARVGALVAPFVPLLSYIDDMIPMLLFGLASIVGGSLIFFLPETLGNNLPENVEDALSVGEKPKPSSVSAPDVEGYTSKNR